MALFPARLRALAKNDGICAATRSKFRAGTEYARIPVYRGRPSRPRKSGNGFEALRRTGAKLTQSGRFSWQSPSLHGGRSEFTRTLRSGFANRSHLFRFTTWARGYPYPNG